MEAFSPLYADIGLSSSLDLVASSTSGDITKVTSQPDDLALGNIGWVMPT